MTVSGVEKSPSGARSGDAVETEWQFEVADLDALRGSIGGLAERAGFTLREEKARNIRDLYLDTEDWRFYRAGYALRLRRTGNRTEATMKALDSEDEGPRRRREISERVTVPRGSKTGTAGDLAEVAVGALRRSSGPVAERLRALAGSRDLAVLFEVKTKREVFDLLPAVGEEDGGVVVDAEGAIQSTGDGALAEVALDETEVDLGRGEGVLLIRRVEVEAPAEEAVAPFVEVLVGTPGLSAAGASKFASGLEAAELEPGETPDLGPTAVDDSMSASEFAFAVLRRHLGEALAHEPGVRIGEDPEDLHDMRVAIRRLRSTLKLYGDYLPKKAERFERQWQEIGGVLGEVRDLDVQIDRLSGDGDVPEFLVPALQARRTERRAGMLSELDSPRYEHLVEEMSRSLARGRPPASPPILEVAPDLVADRYKKVRKRVKRVSKNSTFEELHDLRKKGRRLRYAVEPLGDLYGKPAGKLVDDLKDFQDLLGEQQDRAVTADLLESVALAGGLPAEAVFYLGVEAERRRREAAGMRREIPAAKALRVMKKGDAYGRLEKAIEKRRPEAARGD